MSDFTVRQDIKDAGAINHAPDNSDNAPTITGADGKQYPVKLRQQGWSLRRIASALGVTDPTILNDLRALGAKNLAPATITGADGTVLVDLQGVRFLTPDNSGASHVTGADGKQYPATRP